MGGSNICSWETRAVTVGGARSPHSRLGPDQVFVHVGLISRVMNWTVHSDPSTVLDRQHSILEARAHRELCLHEIVEVLDG